MDTVTNGRKKIVMNKGPRFLSLSWILIIYVVDSNVLGGGIKLKQIARK